MVGVVKRKVVCVKRAVEGGLSLRKEERNRWRWRGRIEVEEGLIPGEVASIEMAGEVFVVRS